MASVRVDKSTVRMTEQTLQELVKACEDAREKIDFTDEPMSDCDMERDQWLKEKARRGQVVVSSPCNSNVSFEIILPDGGGRQGCDQESSGYRLEV